MRIRQVKPSFFKDARIAALSPAVRLFYVGLWMLVDDAGYYRWDAAEAGLELYGYDSRSKRERDVTAHLAALVEAERVTDLGCGHVLIPTLTDHQRFGGPTKRVLTYEKEHLRCTPPRIPAGTRVSPLVPGTVRIGTERELGTERNVSELVDARKRDDDEPTEFQRLTGMPAFLGGNVHERAIEAKEQEMAERRAGVQDIRDRQRLHEITEAQMEAEFESLRRERETA